MKPKERARAVAEKLDKSERRRWVALIEAAIRDVERDTFARVSEKLESQSDRMSPASAAAVVRELMHR
jgi:truncated hemoglobin YjbI